MRLALVSPFPPAKTGIADYSQALLEALRQRADVQVIGEPPARFHPADYDTVFYQLGNNPWHTFVYEMALEHPGISVLHEPNLHHLMTDLTIRRGRWDLYLAEAEYNGGAAALAYARRVKALEVGPDYDGLPMTRRLLERSRGVLVHNQYSAAEVRSQGYLGPLAVVPHGAWLPDTPGFPWRVKLGLDETTPLIGVFGFLKPYKRIAEALRAFRRLLRLEPRARMILAGEVHPEFPLPALIDRLGVGPAVRLLGFTTEEEFSGFMAACDVVLNLRYPTVGESSGSLLRALGLGKAVLVSNVGSFTELPEGVCLKVPVDATEEDLIFEYLNLLVSRPEIARSIGAQARRWVERECSWDRVAGEYVRFAEAVRDGREWIDQPKTIQAEVSIAATLCKEAPAEVAPDAIFQTLETDLAQPEPVAEPSTEPVVPIEYIRGWAENAEALSYVETHKDRLVHTLDLVPPGGPDDHILEMGAYLQITPALKTRLGYGHVRGSYYGPVGKVDEREAVSETGEKFQCLVDNFDAEADPFPYEDGRFATVLCCELLEHLKADPMHMMSEINRITKPGGHLVLTTPNIASLRALAAILQGYHPAFFPAYIKPMAEGETEARHAREYTPKEVWQLLWYSGFEVVKLETGEFREQPHPELHWVSLLLSRFRLPLDLRGDGIYILGRKAGPVRERFPAFLYS